MVVHVLLVRAKCKAEHSFNFFLQLLDFVKIIFKNKVLLSLE